MEKYLEKILTTKDRIIFGLIVFLWSVGQIIFWHWWLQSEHMVSLWRTVLNSALLVWTFVIPGYFFFFVWRMKRPITQTFETLSEKKWRVAMVTTKTSSEPLDILQKTLLAMLSQKYPHDVWLGDEDPKQETIDWCTEYGVKLYSRQGVAEYNRSVWPRRTRCKEGNLAYFYDKFGYRDYDLVVQLDADHVPQSGYLEAILTPFLNCKVGYVSAPSICSANAEKSWSARGRLFAEATMHGPLQAGYTNGFAPLCIGSHYAVRTSTLKEVGGIGPELAEDHSTSMLMQAGGWQGVHAIDAIAYGDGPTTFSDCIKQEFQWSRSLAVLLTVWLPKYWKHLNTRLKFQFLFTQLWYPLFSFTMLVGTALPIIALTTKTSWVHVSYALFIVFSVFFSFLAIMLVLMIKHKKLIRPIDAPILSWEFVVYQIIRWPWNLIGVVVGVIDGLLGKNFEIKVTPKGQGAARHLPLTTVTPYFVIIVGYLFSAFFISDPGSARGYYYFILLGLLFYVSAFVVIVFGHLLETQKVSN